MILDANGNEMLIWSGLHWMVFGFLVWGFVGAYFLGKETARSRYEGSFRSWIMMFGMWGTLWGFSMVTLALSLRLR